MNLMANLVNFRSGWQPNLLRSGRRRAGEKRLCYWVSWLECGAFGGCIHQPSSLNEFPPHIHDWLWSRPVAPKDLKFTLSDLNSASRVFVEIVSLFFLNRDIILILSPWLSFHISVFVISFNIGNHFIGKFGSSDVRDLPRSCKYS